MELEASGFTQIARGEPVLRAPLNSTVSRRMSSPWLNVPLADYEGHMSAANVGQAELLADVFANALEEFRPATVAVIGCAGGNGFDRIDSQKVSRVVGIDINPAYLDVASRRYSDRFRELQLCCVDIARMHVDIEPVDLVYAALVFEYVDVPPALQFLLSACRAGGHLVTLLQLPSTAMAAVTPTSFSSLQTLSSVLNFVDPAAFREIALNAGFEFRRATTIMSGAGKEFSVQVFQRSWADTALERTPGG